jgi:osmotically inducible protein OsmC
LIVSCAFEGEYSFTSRMENGPGTNPEELIGAAEAGCFSMAFANDLSKAGHTPQDIRTSATVHFGQTEGTVPGIDEATFKKIAEDSKKNCPVSKALASTEITLEATLKSGVAAR